MKLNKTICKKCCNKNRTYWEYSENRMKNPWNKEDESNWKNGEVMCPNKSGARLFTINDIIPENCFYRLEHIISNAK
jgi:hypothetical protein